MKRKITMLSIAILIALITVFTIYKLPHKVVDISSEEVSKISIINDEEITITDKEIITSIINNLSNITFRRDLPSGIGGRMQYLIRIYDKNDKEKFYIAINDETKIDDGKFLYHSVNSKIDLNYFEGLFKDKIMSKLENLYKTSINYTGQAEDEAYNISLSEKMKDFLHDMEEKHNGFVMDAYNYQYVEEENDYVYNLNELNNVPIEISPNGYSITVSKNYFKYNPILTAKGEAIDSLIQYDDNIQNILVPEKYADKENEIIKAFKEVFYFEKVEVDNIYREKLGLELNHSKLDDLKINIIYVKDNQNYFTFDNEISPKTNNFITDPIVTIYTENTHCTYAQAYLTQNFYFTEESLKDENGAITSITPLVKKHNLENSIKKVESVYKTFGEKKEE